MKIGRFELIGDTHGWSLVETRHGFNKKTGKPTRSIKNRYYPKLDQALLKLAELETTGGTPKKLMDSWANTVEEIKALAATWRE